MGTTATARREEARVWELVGVVVVVVVRVDGIEVADLIIHVSYGLGRYAILPSPSSVIVKRADFISNLIGITVTSPTLITLSQEGLEGRWTFRLNFNLGTRSKNAASPSPTQTTVGGAVRSTSTSLAAKGTSAVSGSGRSYPGWVGPSGRMRVWRTLSLEAAAM